VALFRFGLPARIFGKTLVFPTFPLLFPLSFLQLFLLQKKKERRKRIQGKAHPGTFSYTRRFLFVRGGKRKRKRKRKGKEEDVEVEEKEDSDFFC
jgi:hypothetical protein